MLHEWIWKFAPGRAADVLNLDEERFKNALEKEFLRLEIVGVASGMSYG